LSNPLKGIGGENDPAIRIVNVVGAVAERISHRRLVSGCIELVAGDISKGICDRDLVAIVR
jgi:hypothetical protein